MVYILLLLVGVLITGTWFLLLQDPTQNLWILGLVLGVLFVGALIYFIVQRARAKRSAKAMEAFLADQGNQQAMNARPERRAEIQALQKQITEGIGALKASKLGGKSGGNALYSLPWYAIIGPPGAGKTTALRHSGLQFPFSDDAVKGVGGTRNCDWWFTNDAILLDTAGRYATEASDQGEWFAFLDMLRKYRKAKPLNGLIVAISITDIIDADEAQLEVIGKTLRARIDEVMTRLRMTLPVYFLVTKCDLIAGFSEYFGDLRKSERAQAWGATFALKEDKRDPGALFAREFDLLVQTVHARANKRMAFERNRQAREAIYQFPLEFAGIKRNIQDLLSVVFLDNPFQASPVFRGFYFTSGTQEGTPMGRVLQRMGQAMGIQPSQVGQQPRVESKSYFLTDVFMNVMFPDADIAAQSEAEVKRQKRLRYAVSGLALVTALVFALPSTISFFDNRDLLEQSSATAEAVAAIDWKDNEPITEKLEKLDALLALLQQLDQYDQNLTFGVNFDLMYVGDTVDNALLPLYVAALQKGFTTPSQEYLERILVKIKKGDKDNYFKNRQTLKQYLMLSDVAHLDRDWAIGRYLTTWAEVTKGTAKTPREARKKAMRPHLEYYFDLIAGEKPRAKPVPPVDKAVEIARQRLGTVAVDERYYALFVNSINFVLIDPFGDEVRNNRVYPPLTLQGMFRDREGLVGPDKVIHSHHFRKTKTFLEIEGPYTEIGHLRVLSNIKQAGELLRREQWVVPLTGQEKGDRIKVNVKALAEAYDTRYINVWTGFLNDIRLRQPTSLKEAVGLYKALLTEDFPVLRIIRQVEDHTQWKKTVDKLKRGLSDIALRQGQQKAGDFSDGAFDGMEVSMDRFSAGGHKSVVPSKFRGIVQFGVADKAGGTTPLNGYMDSLLEIRNAMVDLLDQQPDAKDPNLDINRRIKQLMSEVEKQVEPLNAESKRALRSLLLPPLNYGAKPITPALYLD